MLWASLDLTSRKFKSDKPFSLIGSVEASRRSLRVVLFELSAFTFAYMQKLINIKAGYVIVHYVGSQCVVFLCKYIPVFAFTKHIEEQFVY